MKHLIRILGALLCAASLSLGVVYAQAPAGGRGGGGRGGPPPAPVVPVDPHDLNGYWMLPPDFNDGRDIPSAALVPAVTRQKLAEVAAKDREALRYCNQMGMPAMMGLGSPYNIRISKDLMVIVTEYAPAQNRWIYLNRPHISTEAYDPSIYGDSVGKWDGNTLVVDTTMFHPDHGMFSIPGGGFKTPDSKLVERFQMLKNGQVLQLISTWTDGKVFRTPHTYEYRYNKLPGYDGRLGSPCDPYDADRVQFLTRQKRATP